ncbi:MAG: DUF434 domain-containing protein [Alkalispirochaetaceae bacterium]
MDQKDLEGVREAAGDYRFLLDRGYPEQSARKLVGDRYALSREERLILYRGVCSTATAIRRRSRLIPAAALEGELLFLDFYNLAFTIINYRLGRPLFLSTDGLLRDAGALHGRLGRQERLSWVLDPLVSTLGELRVSRVEVAFDAPVSHSAEHAARLRQAASGRRFSLTAELLDSADYPLRHARKGILATADSAIIDASHLPVFDLAAYLLRTTYAVEPPDLAALL